MFSGYRPALPLVFRAKAGILAASLLILATATACSSIKGEPFSAFSTSVQQLREGADASLSTIQNRTRDRHIVEASTGDFSKIEPLLLKREAGDPFGWSSSNPPLFMKTARFRDGVFRLNSTLVSYSGLLVQLSSGELAKTETFDQLARDLNGNLRDALTAVGVPQPPNKEIAILSTAASAGFRAYIQAKQKTMLLDALRQNQPAIEEASELGASAVRIAALALRNEYDLLSGQLAAKKSVRDLVDLNDKFVKEMQALRILHLSYKSLPAAHSELAAGISDPAIGFPMIRELWENGRSLLRLYEDLSKAEKK